MLGKVVIIGVLLTIVGLVVMKAIDPNLESNGNGGGISIDGSLTGSDTITVGITGDVVSPNNYTLNEGATMADLIELAGGVTDSADDRCYFFEAPLKDNESYFIPSKFELDDVCGNNIIEKVNINEASVDELDSISGVGETIANKIYQYREENGQFYTLEDLKNVDGIGNATFSKMKNEIMLKNA